MARTPTHKTWSMMKQRCYNPKAPDYDKYGALGIVVCEQWHTFEGFFSDMGVRPEGMTLDRRDPSGDYCPSNCRWATPAQQQRNRRCSLGEDNARWVRWATAYAGVTQVALARAFGVSQSLINRVLTGEYYTEVSDPAARFAS